MDREQDAPQGKLSWPAYNGWAPFFAMIAQAITAGGLGYTLFEIYRINVWIALGIAAAAAFGVGVVYNLLAPKIGWQKLYWIDLLFGIDPFILP